MDPIEEGEKVKAEISSILYKDHVQHLKKEQQWWVQRYTDLSNNNLFNLQKHATAMYSEPLLYKNT